MRDTIMSGLVTLKVKGSSVIANSGPLGNALWMNFDGVKRGGVNLDFGERKYTIYLRG